MSRHPPAYQFDLSGGALCLDFVNTVGDRPRRHEEHLHGLQDLVAWAEQAGVVSAREAAALRRRPAADAHDERTFARALDLREHLYALFSALAAGRQPRREDLDALNAALAEAMGHARVNAQGDGFAWTWAGGDAGLARVLWPVARSAADLLVSAERADVRECASATCSWLFVDRSRTHRRRWCSMKTCGNRDKARRFYRRKVGSEKPEVRSQEPER